MRGSATRGTSVRCARALTPVVHRPRASAGHVLTSFLSALGRRKIGAKREVGVARYGERLKCHVGQHLERICLAGSHLDLLETFRYVQREVHKQTVGGPSHLKIAEEDIGFEKVEDLIDDVLFVCAAQWRVVRRQRARAARAVDNARADSTGYTRRRRRAYRPRGSVRGHGSRSGWGARRSRTRSSPRPLL